MTYQQTLGNRIRLFRKRAGLSQMDLEIKTESSPGSMSRIESGDVNPTKETVYKIADALNLSSQEREYFYGTWFYPASDDEVKVAINDTKEYFEKKGVLAYVLDERFRFIAISRSYQKLLGFADSDVDQAFLKPFVDLVATNKFGVQSTLQPEELERILKNLFRSFYSDCYFMEDDDIYKAQLVGIKNDVNLLKLWKGIVEGPLLKHNDEDSRKVYYDLLGKEFSMTYSRDPLYHNRRFEIVEYKPDNPFIRLVGQLVL